MQMIWRLCKDMNFKEEDKVLIKRINSDLIHILQVEESISKIEFLVKVENDAALFSIILHNRGDNEHSKEYIATALNANKHARHELLKIESHIVCTS